MAAWLDGDRPYTPEELARLLEVDVRFFNVAESAGMTLDQDGRTTIRAFWFWFVEQFEAFRRVSGMRELKVTKTQHGKEQDRARNDAALLTIIEFFGVLPCEKAVFSAAEILRPKKTRKVR